MTKVCREQKPVGLTEIAVIEMARRITAKANGNGVAHLMPDKIFAVIGIQKLEDADLGQLKAIESMLHIRLSLSVKTNPHSRVFFRPSV